MGEKLILYGAGRYGVFAALVLSAAGNAPCCFCDKKTAEQIEPITGLPIISPQALKSEYLDSKIIITAFTQKVIDEIYVDLEILGIDVSQVPQFYSLPDALMQNTQLMNYISRHGIHRNITILSAVLKDRFEIRGDVLRFNDLYLPYDVTVPALFGEYAISLLNYIARLPYTRENVGIVDSVIASHAYLLDDVDTPMIISRGDIVIDAGAWFGDFSLLAAKAFDAEVYAFEPGRSNYDMLLKTIALNDCGDRIHAVKLGLSDRVAQLRFQNNPVNCDGSKISDNGDELIDVITIDAFVAEKGLERVDFIKADIEGAEREMLKGATKTLRDFAPKISLCTYHYPDDPVLLRLLISNANPAYKFEHRKNILFAWVEK